MIIFFTAPKGGVGSSTLTVLLARERARSGRVLLVDAAYDPSLDLYTSSEHLVQETFSGSLSKSAVPLDETEQLCFVRIEPDRLMEISWEEEISAGLFSDILIDLGVPQGQAFDLLCRFAPTAEILVILTQDNEVLRAADRLLGSFRDLGIQARFLVNKMEERDAQELADLDEIFSLLEEDYLGFVRYDHSLRYVMNRGRIEEVASGIRVNVTSLEHKIYGTGESVPAVGIGEQRPTAHPDGVMSRIRTFFRNLGKGN